MSGGHFNYKQYELGYIVDEIEQQIINNDLHKEAWDPLYSKETIAEFRNAIYYLKKAQIYAQRVDWLLSADDGEDTFHSRLREELSKLE